MAETNGHAPAEAPALEQTASADELDALLGGVFDPQTIEVAPGRFVELRPLRVGNADRLYQGTLGAGGLQKFLMERCVFIDGKRLGELVDRLPVAIMMKLAPLVMKLNGMEITTEPADTASGEPIDPKD